MDKSRGEKTLVTLERGRGDKKKKRGDRHKATKIGGPQYKSEKTGGICDLGGQRGTTKKWERGPSSKTRMFEALYEAKGEKTPNKGSG